MKRLLLFLTCVLTLFGVSRAQDYELAYTLTPTADSKGNSSYTGTGTAKINNIEWKVEGNVTLTPWRIGGKDLSNADRAVYNQTTISGNIGKVEMTVGDITCTLNSFTFIVAKDANFSNTVYSQNYTVSKSSTLEITKPAGQDWSNCYYKFLFKVTAGGSNQYVQFSGAKFYTVKQQEKEEFKGFNSSYAVTEGESVSLGNDLPTNVTYTPSSSNVFSITGSTLKGLSAGTATVNASWTEDAKYQAGSASFAVTVNPKGQGGDETPNPEGYVLINKTTDLEEGGLYVIAFTDKGTSYSMGKGTSNIPAKEVEITNNVLVPNENTLILTLEKSGENWLWKVVNEGGLYNGNYVSNGSSTGTALTNTNNPGTSQQSTIEFDNDFAKIKILRDNRNLQGNGTTDFRAYANQNWDTYNKPSIYKYTKSSTEEPPVVEKPGKPVVKIGEEELEDGGAKTVAAGTVLKITCDGATSIEGDYADVPFELTSEPFEYTINESGDLLLNGINEGVRGEVFTYTFTVGEVDPNMPAVGSTFKQVLNANKETELVADAYYVIARKEVSVVMSKMFNESTGYFSAIESSTFEDYEQKYYNTKNAPNTSIDSRTITLLSSSENDLIVKLVKENDAWGIKTVNYGDGLESSQKFLNANGYKIILSDEFVPASIDFTLNNNVNIKYADANNNLSYTSSNSGCFNASSGNAIQLYKYTTAKKFDFPVKDLRLKVGDKYTFEIEDPKPEITYKEKQDAACIQVQGSTVIAQETQTVGVGTVMAFWDDSEDWFGNLVEIPVTVRYPADLEFRHAVVRGKKDVGVVWQAAYYNGDGTLTYYSSDDNAVQVNPETGQILPENIQNAEIDKEYVITARVTGDAGSFVEDDASYIIIIESTELPKGEAEGNFDFVTLEDNGNRPYNMFPFESGNEAENNVQYYEQTVNQRNDDKYKNHTPVTHITAKDNDKLTIDFDKDCNYRSWINNGNVHLRVYKDGEFTISVENGTIEEIGFGGASLNQLNEKASDEGVYGTYEASNENQVANWKINSGKETSSVTFKVAATLQIKDINVKVKVETGSDEFTLSFPSDKRVINAFEGEEISIPTLSAEGLSISDITFDIDEIDEQGNEKDPDFQNYVKNEPTGFDDIKITVYEPGVYTFRAEYKVEDEVKGMAILRLNVFPRLSVAPTKTPDDGSLADDKRTESPNLTLVEPAKGDDGVDFATIVLPTLGEKNDDFKYSTVKMTEVIVKHGEDKHIYTLNDSGDLVNEKGETIPANFDFTEDGSVSYTLRYGDTYDMSSTIHVVLMPQVPAVDASASESAVITPSKNSYLQYLLKVSSKSESTDSPNLGDIFRAKRRVAVSEEWTTVGTKDTPYTFSKSEIEGDNEANEYTLVIRSMKDLTEPLGEDYNHEKGTELYSGELEVILASDGNVTVGVDDVIADDEDALFFDVNGYQVDGDRLEKGRIYIKVVNGTAVKVVK